MIYAFRVETLVINTRITVFFWVRGGVWGVVGQVGVRGERG